MQYLVLGANGYVGSNIFKHLKQENMDVIGTVHCREGDKALIPFDILKDSVTDLTKSFTDKEKIAIFCVAQANLEKCRTEYSLARKINVIYAQEVIKKLVDEHFYVIYFSTDNVFDGTKGNYTEMDLTHAVSQYGKMKEEMEQFLVNSYPEVCIFRMPRVIGIEREKQNLFTDFENKIAEGKINCIKDNIMSIICKEDIYQACVLASQKQIRGLYNLSNGEIYSRKQLATRFFELMGGCDIDIVELELEKFGFKDIRPLNVSLNNTKFKDLTNHTFMTYDMMIKQYLVKNRTLNL